MTPVPVLDHARPFSANPGAPTAVLLCHGFTGSPASMVPWARALADHGLRVDVPRLPGHGTHWREMAITGWDDWYRVTEQHLAVLAAECEQVFVAGLSMGGALALRLAELHDVAGVLLVNPAIATADVRFRFLGALRHLVASQPAIGNDIALPGQDEHAYDRVPVASAWSMAQGWRQVRDDLGRLRADVLLMTSSVDHVVDATTRRLLVERLPRVEQVVLERSHHVATLDHDAPLVVERSLDFIARHGGQVLRDGEAAPARRGAR